MKRYSAKNRILSLSIILMLFSGVPLFAQENQDEMIGRIVQAKGQSGLYLPRVIPGSFLDARKSLHKTQSPRVLLDSSRSVWRTQPLLPLRKTPNSFSTNTALMVKMVLLIAPSWNWCVVDSELLMV